MCMGAVGQQRSKTARFCCMNFIKAFKRQQGRRQEVSERWAGCAAQPTWLRHRRQAAPVYAGCDSHGTAWCFARPCAATLAIPLPLASFCHRPPAVGGRDARPSAHARALRAHLEAVRHREVCTPLRAIPEYCCDGCGRAGRPPPALLCHRRLLRALPALLPLGRCLLPRARLQHCEPGSFAACEPAATAATATTQLYPALNQASLPRTAPPPTLAARPSSCGARCSGCRRQRGWRCRARARRRPGWSSCSRTRAGWSRRLTRTLPAARRRMPRSPPCRSRWRN